jgi:hypothetical protein
VEKFRLWTTAATIALGLIASADGTAQSADTTCAVVLRGADFVGVAADLARVISLQDSTARESFMLRRIGREYQSAACRAPAAVQALAEKVGTPVGERRAALLPVELLTIANSAYPRDWNDGALWAGRGVNASLTGGVEVRWGLLRAALAPVLTWQQNNAYDMPAVVDTTFSPYAHPFFGNIIDAPQRFGPESFGRADLGQSFVRIDVRGFAAGFSNENLTWGPARRNPLLLSGTGPGFPHVFIETGRPVNVGIGALEFQLFWGRLTESEYFDEDPDNDHRALAGIMGVFEPSIFNGFYIGAGRLHARTWWPDVSLSDVLFDPYQEVRVNVPGRSGNNQLIALFFRWATAPYGLEVYGEWAREDHWGTSLELLRNLDASQAFSLGLQKVVRRGDKALRIAAEISHLADALPILFAGRGFIPYYTNTSVRQGHTQRGQLLGAAIGTGAESQYVGADYFWRAGRTSLSLERTRYQDDAYNGSFAPYYGAQGRDVELSMRGGHVTSFGALTVDAELGWSLRYNRGFLGLDSQVSTRRFRREDNWSLRVGSRWTPRSFRP